jgi:hypothetical protein
VTPARNAEIAQTHLAVQRVLTLYAHLLDDLRFDDWGQLFCENATWMATWNGQTQTFCGRNNIVAALREIEPKAPGAVRHCPLAPIIDLNGEEAYSWSDAVMLTLAPGANVVVSVGRYHDILRFERGRWRFFQRVFVSAGDRVPAGIKPCPGE